MILKKDNFTESLFIAGAGGQGVLQAGRIIAQSCVMENRYATYYPSYGAEVRGGTANCTVIISNSEIISPVVPRPENMIIMNIQSMGKFSRKVAENGLLLVNSSLASCSGADFTGRVKVIEIPASRIAEETGNIRCANVVMLGAFIRARKILSVNTLMKVIGDIFRNDPGVVSANIRALEKGMSYV